MRRNKLATVAIAALAVTAFAACGDDDDNNEDPLDTVVDDVQDDLEDTATTLGVPGT